MTRHQVPLRVGLACCLAAGVCAGSWSSRAESAQGEEKVSPNASDTFGKAEKIESQTGLIYFRARSAGRTGAGECDLRLIADVWRGSCGVG